MEKTKKVWGTKTNIYRDDLSEVSVLELKKDTTCSYHFHHGKWNLFYLLKGEVGIRTEWGVYILRPGETFTTRPLEKHRFEVYEDSLMIEVMYVKYTESDIIRDDLGGTLDASNS